MEKYIAAIEPLQSNFLNSKFYIPGLFTPEECQKIIELKGRETRALVSGINPRVDVTERYNLSKSILPYQENLWIFKRIMDFIIEANKRYFNFDINGLETLQLLTYRKRGFYNWHVDLGSGKISTRKLSLVIFLSDQKDYKGGRLVWKNDKTLYSQNQGACVVFPSYMMHKVEPVTEGERYTLVSWICGNSPLS